MANSFPRSCRYKSGYKVCPLGIFIDPVAWIAGQRRRDQAKSVDNMFVAYISTTT